MILVAELLFHRYLFGTYLQTVHPEHEEGNTSECEQVREVERPGNQQAQETKVHGVPAVAVDSTYNQSGGLVGKPGIDRGACSPESCNSRHGNDSAKTEECCDKQLASWHRKLQRRDVVRDQPHARSDSKKLGGGWNL